MRPYKVHIIETTTITKEKTINVLIPDDKDNYYAENLVKMNPELTQDMGKATEKTETRMSGYSSKHSRIPKKCEELGMVYWQKAKHDYIHQEHELPFLIFDKIQSRHTIGDKKLYDSAWHACLALDRRDMSNDEQAALRKKDGMY